MELFVLSSHPCFEKKMLLCIATILERSGLILQQIHIFKKLLILKIRLYRGNAIEILFL